MLTSFVMNHGEDLATQLYDDEGLTTEDAIKVAVAAIWALVKRQEAPAREAYLLDQAACWLADGPEEDQDDDPA